MSPELIALVSIVLTVVLLVLGAHIGLVLMLVGALGILAVTGNFAATIGILRTVPFSTAATYAFTIVPLFILMGHFSLHGGISERAYRAINNWLGRLPGGLAIATTWACAAFGATSGSNIAAASVFTKISLPEMRKAGYDKNFACGGIAMASMLAQIIPPSLFLVIYGMLAEVSIAKMLIAGVLPGLIMATTLSMGTWIIAMRYPRLAPISHRVASLREKLTSTAKAWPIAVLAGVTIGGIYSGVFTPTEAAALGALAALIIALGHRGLNLDKLKGSLLETAQVTGMVFLILIGATIFACFLTRSGITTTLSEGLIALGLSPLPFVIILTLLYLVIGCFIDGLSAMFITMPVFFPAVLALGIDPIWFGVVIVVALLMGSITPPFGIGVFVVKAVAGPDVTVEGVFRGALPYYLPMLTVVAILIAFPQISTFLPNMMVVR